MPVYQGNENFGVSQQLMDRVKMLSRQQLQDMWFDLPEDRSETDAGYIGSMYWHKFLQDMESQLPKLRRGDLDAFHGQLSAPAIPPPDKASIAQLRWYYSLEDDDLPPRTPVSDVVRIAVADPETQAKPFRKLRHLR